MSFYTRNASVFTKFSTMTIPLSVMMLSGWN